MELQWLRFVLGGAFFHTTTSYMDVEWLYHNIVLSASMKNARGNDMMNLFNRHIDQQVRRWLTNADHEMTYVKVFQQRADAAGITYIQWEVITCYNCGAITMDKHRQICYKCWFDRTINTPELRICKCCKNSVQVELTERKYYPYYGCIKKCEYQCQICEKRCDSTTIVMFCEDRVIRCVSLLIYAVMRIPVDTVSVLICRGCRQKYIE